jgi:putative oxidoreductase
MNNKLGLASRLFLGLVFTVFGLNGFLNFLPMPPLPEQAGQFLGALGATGYFFPVLKGTEVICGVLLLVNKFAALSVVILAPIILQIVLFHGILTPGISNSILPLVIAGAAIAFAVAHKDKYASLLKA